MKSYEERLSDAKRIYAAALKRVKTTPEPEGQKFHVGQRVRINDNLGLCMRHFPCGCLATVEHTHAHAFRGGDVKAYSLNVDGHGSIAWYWEHQLSPVTGGE
jgi:hypothetical protein